jgi:hypothetical protein
MTYIINLMKDRTQHGEHRCSFIGATHGESIFFLASIPSAGEYTDILLQPWSVIENDYLMHTVGLIESSAVCIVRAVSDVSQVFST